MLFRSDWYMPDGRTPWLCSRTPPPVRWVHTEKHKKWLSVHARIYWFCHYIIEAFLIPV